MDRFEAVEKRLKSRIVAHRFAWGLAPLALAMTLLTIGFTGGRLAESIALARAHAPLHQVALALADTARLFLLRA